MENQASCCTSLSATEVEVCKLPLLDANTSESAKIITTEVRLENAENTFDACRRDRLLFSGTVCTAWALLLRCYTGQDRVTFEYTTENANATASFLRMSFGEDETSSKYTEKAKDAIIGIEQKRLAAIQSTANTATSNTISRPVNTAVCICDSEMPPGMLTAKAAGKTAEVSAKISYFRTLPTVRLTIQSGTHYTPSANQQ